MINWKKFSQIEVFKKLLLKRDATLTVQNADGTESHVAVADLAIVSGLTADAAELNTMDGILATTAELNRSADASARIVTSTATVLALTVTEHAERIVLINSNSTVANTFTLPAAAGTGAKFHLINNIVQTQGTVVIAANGTDVMNGVCLAGHSTTTTGGGAFFTSASSDKVTLNLTTTGGDGGDSVEAWDVAANTWHVRVFINGSGSLGTPFSETA